ncbi:MAG: YraN family protein [Alphaproteobacteria bacterium]|nr:YraN family protein [Alphaproteobacteria bacterium]
MNGKKARAGRGKEAERYGRFAEGVCVGILLCKGYHILARRHRTPVGEIDVVAKRGPTVVFVEIKARKNQESAGEAITQRQQSRILRAAEHFLGARPELAKADIRFDAMLVGHRTLPHHVKDAWRRGFDGVR